MADQVTFQSLADSRGDLAVTEERKSKAQVLQYLAGTNETFEILIYTAQYYVTQNDRVVAVGSTSWKKRGTENSFGTPKIDVIRLENGKIVEFPGILRHRYDPGDRSKLVS